jgi:uncharacterized repeat protein (TIGR02543 family)
VGTTPFELSYDSNGGSDIQSRKFTEATDVNFDDPDYIPTLEGYTFTGWYADKDLVTRLNGTVKVSDSMTVYAGWKEETKKVTLTLVYDPLWQYIGVGTPDVKIEMTEGTEVDLETLTIPDHEDDAKVSWYEESGDVSTVIKSPFVMNSDKTIYAGASIGGSTGPKETESEEPAVTKPFYLSYNTNGGSYINTRKFTETTAVDFEDENYIPTREGYTFTGWYTTSDLQTRLTGKVDVSKDMTVWAGWKLKTVETERQTEPTTETAAKSATESTTKSATESETESETESTTDSTIDSTTKSATGDKIRAASARATNSSDSGTESPKTGDQSNLSFWFVLLLISGLEIIVTMICKKRHAGR